MRVLTYSAIAVCAMVLTGCASSPKSVEKTVRHSDGTLNVSNVRSIEPYVEARNADGDYVDARGLNEDTFEALQGDRRAVPVRGGIAFDGEPISLQNEDISSWRRFRNFRDDIDDYYEDLNKFMRGSNPQLDIRRWQE